MTVHRKNKWFAALIVAVGVSTTCAANGYNHGHYHEGYHGRGPGPAWGWGMGPNIVINVPTPRYYVPACETVRVCDQYGYCWLERECE